MVAASGEDARRNGDQYTTYDSGMCQQYVRGPCWEVGSLYGSAIEAWNGSTMKHTGDRTPPEGAPVYYSGGQYGHAVISQGGGRIRSTDAPSGGKVSDQDLDWPEKNWGYKYLGWTGDINGVDLPITGDGDDDVKPEDIEAIAKRVNQTLGDYTADGKKRDGVKDPEQGDARLRQIENKVQKILEILNAD